MPFKKGVSGNAKGRPPAGEAFLEQLRTAISAVEKNKKKSLMQHAVERAFVEDTVLIALMKKLIPDKMETDLNVGAELAEMLKLARERANAKTE